MRATTELYATLILLLAACDDGSDGADGSPGQPGGGTDDDLVAGEDPPGLVLEILSVAGASGPGGGLQAGDVPVVTFRLRKDDGSPWDLDELAFGRAHVAGPTFNYQRVLPEVEDVLARAEFLGGARWRYAFADPLPATYAPPYNDSPSFGPDDGEWTGQPLLDGTYTVGLSFGWRFTVDGQRGFVDVGEDTHEVLFGGSSSLAPRRVTQLANCNLCHVRLTYHEGERRELTQCLMCHTSGAEDPNDPEVGGGTPGVSIESRVLFHKLHNASHLPSVVGIGVRPDGELDHAADPEPLTFATPEGTLLDRSFIGFPAFPNRLVPKPKNFGWSDLTEEGRRREDLVRSGVIACARCHGDPDGDGPIEAPADGDLIYAQPTRRVCGACHDDIDWDLPYTTNLQTMPPQPDDGSCIDCHDDSLSPLGIRGGHRHPLDDPFFDPGRHVNLVALADRGGDGDGSLDAGERLEVTFTVTDDQGADVDVSELEAVRVALAGPTTSQQVLFEGELPLAALGGPQPLALLLQAPRRNEFLGDATAVLGDVFSTARAPHLDVAGAETVVRLRTDVGAGSTTAAAVDGPRGFVDVVDAAAFARDDLVVLDDGGPGEEYVLVQAVEGNRLWFGAPGSPEPFTEGLRGDHPAGTSVRVVTTAPLTEGVDYALDATAGTVTELLEFGAGRAVLADSTAPFELPAAYPPPHHDSDAHGEVAGEWRGKALEPGTYSLTLWVEDSFTISFGGETSFYPNGSAAARGELPVLDPGLDEPYDHLTLPANCNDCHQDLMYHGGTYRGFESCLACHGNSGAEDRPTWVSFGAPETPGQRIDLRWLLHGVHRGRDLHDPEAFVVVGEGEEPFPLDFTARTYEDVRFPADPRRTAACEKCHGEANETWEDPPDRAHPLDQTAPHRAWRDACAMCHDSPAARAHVDSHTAPDGNESCAVCHGQGETWSVSRMHHGY